jgi:hypothetical protein
MAAANAIQGLIMTASRIAITTTTIFEPSFLDAYAQNLQEYGHADSTTIYIAGDRKSPSGTEETVAQHRARGLDVRFLSIDWQHDYLKRWPDLAAVIPENSDNRRNVAYLVALDEGADVVISIDDDNYCLPSIDFVGEHLRVGAECVESEARGSEGWFNLCSMLDFQPEGANLFPRGFPYRCRKDRADAVGSPASGAIGVNVGVWLGDPDCDAIGRLQDHPVVTDWSGQGVLLGTGVRCPINTQNTALSRAAMGAYYYVRMGASLRGLSLDRFGDIFSGYFLQVCAQAVGDRIRIGGPAVDHRRHAHDLFVDLYNELAGVMILEDLSKFFEVPRPCATSYVEAYRSLSYSLEEFVAEQEGFVWTPETRDYFADIGRYMRIWADVVAELG